MNIGTESIQVVVYTSSLDLSNKLKLAEGLSKVKAITFDGEPMILPIPEDAPLEFPRITLRTKDGFYSLSIAPSRTDIFYQEKDTTEYGIDKKQVLEIREKLINAVSEIIEIVTKDFAANINRIAVVTKQIIKLETSSKDFLQGKLIQELDYKPEEIKLAFLSKETLGDFKINKWHRLDTLRNKKDPSDDRALGLVYDINTLAEIEYKFTSKIASKLFSEIFIYIDKETKAFIAARR